MMMMMMMLVLWLMHVNKLLTSTKYLLCRPKWRKYSNCCVTRVGVLVLAYRYRQASLQVQVYAHMESLSEWLVTLVALALTTSPH